MIDLVYDNLAHFVAAAMLFSRLGDVIGTYLLTPSLVLEATPSFGGSTGSRPSRAC